MRRRGVIIEITDKEVVVEIQIPLAPAVAVKDVSASRLTDRPRIISFAHANPAIIMRWGMKSF